MSDWTAGYMADIAYTYGYYAELNPLRAKMALLSAGLECPDFTQACELGFGQGLSLNMHAAAGAVQWCGTDFHPGQAGYAQSLAAASGAPARLYDHSFAEFAARDDLPEFDYIALHGIWSWISDENRNHILDLVRKRLKVGGVVYVSYNTQPGWAAFAPIQHLIKRHNDTLSAPGANVINRIDAAFGFTEQLERAQARYILDNPAVKSRLEALGKHSKQYLAHEYFNRNWHPFYFDEVADQMAAAKLDFACSAKIIDHIDAANLTGEQIALLNGIPDIAFRETVRDFVLNRQFRRDFWVKGARKMNTVELMLARRALRVMLMNPRESVVLKAKGALGEGEMSEAVYGPILDVLASQQVMTVGEIEQKVSSKGINLNQVFQAVQFLYDKDDLALAQDEATIAATKPRVDALNRRLMEQSRSGYDIHFLASPVTGGGIRVNPFQQLFLLAGQDGKTTPADWASYAWEFLSMRGERLVKDGATLETAEANLEELTTMAQVFAGKPMGILKVLQIA